MTDSKYYTQDAETAVLSIILKNPTSFSDLKELKYFMFSSSPNQLVFKSISDIIDSGLVPEYNLVVDSLQVNSKLSEAGGESYLKYLSDQNYELSNLHEFVNIVIKSYKSRSVISVASKVPAMVKDGDDIDEIINSVKTSLDNLTVVGGGESTTKISDELQGTWDDIVKRTESRELRGVPTGFKKIDSITGGFGKGDLWIIAGRPSQGKSAWLCNSALKGGGKSLIFSLEMPKRSLIERFIALDTGIPLTDIRFGTLNKNQITQISESIPKFKDLPIHIDANFTGEINYVISTIRKYKKIYDVDTVYLDYIQLLAERTTNATNELGQISRLMKIVSNDLGISTIILSQLNRSVEQRDDKRPIQSDLRQSGNLEEDADIIAMLYRDEYYYPETKRKGELEFIIRKHRNGPIGTLFFNFEAENNRIGE